MLDSIKEYLLDNFSISAIYVFGGCIQSANYDDVDLIIISDDFIGISRLKRTEAIILNYHYVQLDPICLTTEEFNRLMNQGSIFLKKILLNSIKIYERKAD